MESKTTTQAKNLLWMFAACAVSALLIKLPAIFPNLIDEQEFLLRDGSIIFCFGTALYLLLTNGMKQKIQYAWVALAFALPSIYVNLLPSAQNNDTIVLVLMHAALLMWCILGIVYIRMDRSLAKRMDYIRYNGDLVVIMAILSIAGGLFSAITLGLFELIGFKIEEFYMQYIGLCGVVCIPIVSTWVIRNEGIATNKLAPIVANIFSPMVLLMLFLFLASLPFSSKSPFSDREFLLILNALLLGVMAIIVFAISETSKNKKQQFSKIVLTLTAIAALIINSVALTAILYRLSEYGFTPNRTAVLGANILLFIHLIWIAISLVRASFFKKELTLVENTVSWYLPVYAIWTLFVVVGFPLIFGYH